jgi:hypothetical protein
MKGLKIKHELIEAIKTPKLIFAGGSNLAFGIDSKEIADSLGIHVINMSLHAGLGASFILNDIKSCVAEGDIVVLSLEYFLEKEGQYPLLLNAEKYYPKAKNFFRHDIGLMTDVYLQDSKDEIKRLFGQKKEKQDSVYTSSAFNQYGDVVSHLNQPHLANLRDKETFQYHYWSTIDDLNQFIEYANHNDVKVFYLFPCYTQSQFEINKTAIKKLEADIRKNLECDIVNRPEDFVYADSDFFDTIYHLGKNGREKRTKQLITLLTHDSAFQQKLSFLKAGQNKLAWH